MTAILMRWSIAELPYHEYLRKTLRDVFNKIDNNKSTDIVDCRVLND